MKVWLLETAANVSACCRRLSQDGRVLKSNRPQAGISVVALPYLSERIMNNVSKAGLWSVVPLFVNWNPLPPALCQKLSDLR